MKKYLPIIIALFLVGLPVFATVTNPFRTFEGGTGTTTPSGILYGDNGATNHLNSVTIGSGCTFIAGTLSCAGGSSGGSSNWTRFNNSGLYPATSTDQVEIGSTSTSSTASLDIQAQAGIPGLFVGSSSPYFIVTSTGNVGIGTTTPFAGLSVNSTAGQPQFVIGSSTGTQFIVDQNGNVGIGTSTLPSGTLFDVENGNGNDDFRVLPPTGATPISNGYIYARGGSASGNALIGSALNLNVSAQSGGFINLGTNAGGITAQFNVSNNEKNYFTFTYATASSSPTLGFAGADNNIGLNITPKGTGNVIIRNGSLGIGTTTPYGLLNLASTTASATFQPQLVLTDSSAGLNLKHFTFANEGGNLYIGTSSDVFVTSTGASALTILNNGNVGIGTTTPTAQFSNQLASSTVGTAQLTPFGNLLAMIINGVRYMTESFDYYGHAYSQGPKPTLSSCGTTPDVEGNDSDMVVTVGSVSATGCTINFAYSYATSTLAVTVTNRSMSVVNAMTYTVSATQIVVSQTGLTGDVLDIHVKGIK